MAAPTNGQFLTWDTSLTPPGPDWQTGGGGGSSFTWNNVATNTQALVANNGYLTNNGATLVTYTLPTTVALLSIITVSGFSSGGLFIAQNAGQRIKFGDIFTTSGTGGSLSSSNSGDQISLLCVIANTEFVMLNSFGFINYV